MQQTLVTFPQARLQGCSTALLVQRRGEVTALISALTPFHPQSHLWPDQPGDQGVLRWNGMETAVVDCRMGALAADGGLFVDEAIPARRGEPGWTFVVVHLLAGEATPRVGEEVELRVDETRRRALSLGHSACHLAALALNRALQPLWRKHPGERDAFGQVDFDRLAISRSRIQPNASVDHYRLGKSLRKKGFEAAEALAKLDAMATEVDACLAAWLCGGGGIRQPCDGPTIIDTRHWECDIEGQPRRIPCGGTHVDALARFGSIHVNLESIDDGFVMHTAATPA